MKKNHFLNYQNNKAPEIPYWFIGINISSSVRKLEVALVGVIKARPGAPIFLNKSIAFDLPSEIVSSFDFLKAEIIDENELIYCPFPTDYFDGNHNNEEKKNDSERDHRKKPSCLLRLANLRAMLTSVIDEAISEVIQGSGISTDDIVALIVHAPSLRWSSKQNDDCASCINLIDSIDLSRKTSFNVLDLFERQNLLMESRKCFNLPYWILLGDEIKNRILVDLGETARCYFLPSFRNGFDVCRAVAHNNLVSCGTLLDLFTKQITKGELSVDLGGKLSVQGQCISGLLDLWRTELKTNRIDTNTTCFPCDVNPFLFNESYYVNSLLRLEEKVSSIDALCSAVYWIIENIQKQINFYTEKCEHNSVEIILMGSGKQNGLLYNKLLSCLKLPMSFLNEIGNYQEDSFDAVACATLGSIFGGGCDSTCTRVDIEEFLLNQIGSLTVGSRVKRELLLKYINDK